MNPGINEILKNMCNSIQICFESVDLLLICQLIIIRLA